MWTLLGDPALTIPFYEPTLDVHMASRIGSSEVVVEFNVPEELARGTCETQIQLRPSVRGGKYQQVRLSPPIVNTRTLEWDRDSPVRSLGLCLSLAGSCECGVFVLKDGDGRLGLLEITAQN